MKILVVEDNLNDQELLRRQLNKAGLGKSVLFLDDPRKALDLLQGPDSEEARGNLIALFLDVHLPYMSGIDLLRVVRSIDGLERLPVVVMTSSPHPDIAAACDQLGIVAFVEKPVTADHFSKIIASLDPNSNVDSAHQID